MLNRITEINVGYLLTLSIGFLIGFGSVANAFMQNDRNVGAVDYERTENIERSNIGKHENGTNYSFRLDQVSRKAALEVISDKANLTLTYCSGVFPNSGMVSVQGSKTNFEGAIREVLAGSELGFKITDSRHLVVFKKEEANVSGKVLDKSTGLPLQGARVMLVNKNNASAEEQSSIRRATFVDSEGQYTIEDVDPGTYKLVIAYFGYNKAFEHLHVDRGTTVGNFKIVEKDK